MTTESGKNHALQKLSGNKFTTHCPIHTQCCCPTAKNKAISIGSCSVSEEKNHREYPVVETVYSMLINFHLLQALLSPLSPSAFVRIASSWASHRTAPTTTCVGPRQMKTTLTAVINQHTGRWWKHWRNIIKNSNLEMPISWVKYWFGLISDIEIYEYAWYYSSGVLTGENNRSFYVKPWHGHIGSIVHHLQVLLSTLCALRLVFLLSTRGRLSQTKWAHELTTAPDVGTFNWC